MKIIEYFDKKKSVFAKWQLDTTTLVARSFEFDMGHSKLSKFIKELDDLELTLITLQTYYLQLKDLFNYSIGHPKAYPAITWFLFVDICE